jgi:hypothetical protein
VVVADTALPASPLVVFVVLAPPGPPEPVPLVAALPVAPPDPEWMFDPAEPAPSLVVRWFGSVVPITPQATTVAANERSVNVRATGVGFFSCRTRENVETTPIMLRYLQEDAIRQGLA